MTPNAPAADRNGGTVKLTQGMIALFAFCCGAIVANLYVRNEFDFFGLFADPVAAHTGYSKNDAVLRTMFAA